MSQRDGGPAFPRPATTDMVAQDGMSLRDWFAGQALAGMWAAYDREQIADMTHRDMAEHCYSIADRLVEQRERDS